jgi:hypothetical protein
MKKIINTLLIFGLCSTLSAQQAEQKVLVTLQNGEEPMYYESCIPMSFAGGNLFLVTRLNNQFFVYDKGTRKGPFKDASSIVMPDCKEGEGNSSNCAVLKQEAEYNEKYIKTGDDGKMKIVYNGKTYSEISQVNQLVVSANGLKIAVLGTNDNLEPLMLTPEGKIIALQGEAEKLLLSPSGSLAIVSMKGSTTQTLANQQDQMANYEKMAAEMQSVDMSKMTPEEITTYLQNIQKKYGIATNEQSNSPDFYIFLSDGRKLGPYKLGGYTSDNPAFCITGGDNWYFIDDNKLFVNGSMLKDFGDNSPSTCNIWLSPDGKRYAVFMNYSNLVFSDGQSYPSPLQINAKVENGKALLTWLSLNNKNQIVLYKKTL